MKKLSILLSAVLSAAHMMGCKSNRPENKQSAQEACYPVENPAKLEGTETGDIQIRSAKREGDCLYMEVAYSACGNEPLYLLWNGMIMKSLPPKASVKPVFVHGESRCRRLIEKTVCFSIKSLRENTRNTGLILLIEGYGQPVEIPAEN